MRGGAPIIDVLSRVFKLKCAYLAVNLTQEKILGPARRASFSRELLTVQEMSGNLLLCDDLSDTGYSK